MGWKAMSGPKRRAGGQFTRLASIFLGGLACAAHLAISTRATADEGITVSDLPTSVLQSTDDPITDRRAEDGDALGLPSIDNAVGEKTVLAPGADLSSADDAASSVTIDDFSSVDGACHSCRQPACSCSSDLVESEGLLQLWRDNKLACWTVRAESLLLWRDAPNSRPLMTTFDAANQTLGPSVFDADQLESDMLVAPRITVSRLHPCGRGVEASYLYAGNFYANRSLPVAVDGYAFAAPGIFGNDWGIDGTPISVAQQQVIANLQSGEINLREPIGWGANRFLIGFRWLQWWESWQMVDGFQDPNDPAVTGFDDYRSQCTNNLYGGQIGFDSVLWNKGQGLRLESLVKAGAYYNNVNGSSVYNYATSDGFTFSRQLAPGGPPAAAFVGEVGLTAVLPLRKNFDLRCGYFGLWLEGLAQPTNQLSNQTLTQIDPPAGSLTTKGSAVLQGLSLALEGRW
jgi:hypothetical protein